MCSSIFTKKMENEDSHQIANSKWNSKKLNKTKKKIKAFYDATSTKTEFHRNIFLLIKENSINQTHI